MAHTQPDQSQTTASSFYSSLNFRFIKWTFSSAGQERRIPFTEKKKLVSTHVQKGDGTPIARKYRLKIISVTFLDEGGMVDLKKNPQIEIYRQRSKAAIISVEMIWVRNWNPNHFFRWKNTTKGKGF